jgi:HD superfamily phosphohydrolase
MTTPVKQFKDPVHGYIPLRSDWCRDFVDTPVFQRLRHIEQTSMRPLYPAAHHDRFIHSLGTFHLAQRLLGFLQANTQDPELQSLLDNNRQKHTFLIACLMHDCGHAPFSHTFEGFYNYTEAKTAKRAYELLQTEFPHADFKVEGSFDPAPHEALSAVVLNRFYGDKLDAYGCDRELAARMITGCTYPDERTTEKRVCNRLIGLLNGKAIDVDKLDYILRDTWSSGVQNTAIDIERLLSSVELHPDASGVPQLCFRKSALSVIQNVVDARNYLYEWVYNHHTVLYYSRLLDQSLRKLAKHLAQPDDPDSFWKRVFSLEPFEGHSQVSDGVTLHLPMDGDMLYLLKQFAPVVPLPDIEELLAHAPRRVALWKTWAEFRMLFKGAPVATPEVCKGIAARLPEMVAEELSCSKDDISVITALAKHYVIEESHVYVLIDAKTKLFTELAGEEPTRKPGNFFYVFVPREHYGRKQDIVNMIRSQTR